MPKNRNDMYCRLWLDAGQDEDEVEHEDDGDGDEIPISKFELYIC